MGPPGCDPSPATHVSTAFQYNNNNTNTNSNSNSNSNTNTNSNNNINTNTNSNNNTKSNSNNDTNKRGEEASGEYSRKPLLGRAWAFVNTWWIYVLLRVGCATLADMLQIDQVL